MKKRNKNVQSRLLTHAAQIGGKTMDKCKQIIDLLKEEQLLDQIKILTSAASFLLPKFFTFIVPREDTEIKVSG